LQFEGTQTESNLSVRLRYAKRESTSPEAQFAGAGSGTVKIYAGKAGKYQTFKVYCALPANRIGLRFALGNFAQNVPSHLQRAYPP
jgi:hypothetical protein